MVLSREGVAGGTWDGGREAGGRKQWKPRNSSHQALDTSSWFPGACTLRAGLGGNAPLLCEDQSLRQTPQVPEFPYMGVLALRL